ncbi:hypothetical protein Asi02nite_49290 [Asanoa siamensis]|uniref:ABC transporter domain-containing protein n=1 Tax=Asanoa siamensis TaxID=926357 RepID=A0ABQ4CVV7_9ACTN|nr:hypothetical protein Asi02nite_49290 [Asanoa siamensis]
MTTTAVTGPAARAVQVWKVYGAGETEVVALRDVSVELARGKFTAIMGPSGSGKSTLMHCLAGLDTVSRGEVYVGDTRVTGLGDAGLTRLRRDKIGFIFQQFNLLPTLTAEENILLPLSIAGRKPDPEWYRTVIDTVRLGDRLGHRPSQLSGGQQQRVACARALVSRPEVIFADEPTGNLDSRSGADVLTFLRDSVQRHGQTIVMVTHDPVAASYADRVLFLADGMVVDEILNPTADAVLDRMRTIDALDESPIAPGAPEVSGPAPESRGTTDPTGRTPHPGPMRGSGGGPGSESPHRNGDGPGAGGGSTEPRDPGGPTARAVPGAGRKDGGRPGTSEVVARTATATLTAATPAQPQPVAAAATPPGAKVTAAQGDAAALPAEPDTTGPQPALAAPGSPRDAEADEPKAETAEKKDRASNTGTAGKAASTQERDRASTKAAGKATAPDKARTDEGTADSRGVEGAGSDAGEVSPRDGERRAQGGPTRRKSAGAAGPRPAASRPPRGKQRKRTGPTDPSPTDQPEPGTGAADQTATPRKAAKRAAARKPTPPPDKSIMDDERPQPPTTGQG